MEPETLQCPICDAMFYVVWNNSYFTQGGPEYCPFCGAEIDYAAALLSQSDGKE